MSNDADLILGNKKQVDMSESDKITYKDILDAVEKIRNQPYQPPRCGYCGAEIGKPHGKLIGTNFREYMCPTERLERIVDDRP